MQFIDFKKSLSLDGIYPIYIISGKELFLIESALSNLIAACEINLPELNITYFDDEAEMQDILDACETLPFCSSRRMVIVKGYNFTPEKIKMLEDSAPTANASTCLVFTSTTLTTCKNVRCVECDSVPNDILYAKVNVDLSRAGYKIEQKALQMLVKYCQGSITHVYSEIEKLKAICSNNTITMENVQEVCVKLDAEFSTYMLTDAIAKKDSDTALDILNRMILNDTHKTLLAYLYTYFRRLFLCSKHKGSDLSLAEKLGIKPSLVTLAKKHAQSIGFDKVANAMHMLHDIDLKVKTTFASLEDELYLFLFYTLK